MDIQRKGNQIILKQLGLTKHIIEALGLDSKYSTPVDTPNKLAALGQDVDEKKASDSINYASVVGMLLYLGHADPTYLLQCISVQDTTIVQSSHTRMPLKELGII